MNSFKTQSTARKSVLTIIYTFIPMFLLAFFGLKIAVITWLYFEGLLLLVFLFCLFLVSKTRWEIEFKDNNVSLVNTWNHRNYYFENLTQSDIIMKQTQKQKKKNCCDLKIANTPFGIYDVKRYDELMVYIQKNIPISYFSGSVAFTCSHIIEDNKPILYVKHDEDGDWQFLCRDNQSTEDGRIIDFDEAIDFDPTIYKVCNLKCGQTAVRDSKDSEWQLL